MTTDSIIYPSQAERDLARQMGREAGENMGSWAADGNTPQESIRRVLAMIKNGDPRAHDECLPPYPNLSGEWADDLTPLSLAREVTGDDEPSELVMDELAEEWETGVGETFTASCERTLRGFLAD